MNMIEEENQKREREKIQILLKLSVTATLASLGIVLSAVVIFFPNVEFISVSIFLISIIFGVEYGILASISIAVIYEFLVIPIYGSGGLLIIVKLLCYIGLSLISGFGRKFFLKLSFWELGIFGATFALIYDLITTIFGQIIVLQQSVTFYYLVSLMIWGIPFTLAHVVGNFLLFSLSKTIISWIESAFKHRGVRFLMLSQAQENLDSSALIKSTGDKK